MFKYITTILLKLSIVIMISMAITIFVLLYSGQTKASEALELLTYTASLEGCYNEDTQNALESSLASMYNTTLLNSDTDGDGVNDKPAISFQPGCTSVVAASGNSVMNTTANAYLNHVQRGEPLICSVTVSVDYVFPFQVPLTNQNLHIERDITVTNTVISTRWFKGDL